MPKKPFTYISLFSCAGVGCYGFKQAGFECVATNELSSRRLAIQKYNHKCHRNEGYVCGDITLDSTKQLIYDEIAWWKDKRYISEIDVVIATPPCQGMSIFNHKKNDRDIERNSLVIESLNIVKQIQPKFFVFENVPAFMDTECIIEGGERCSIGEAHQTILGDDYSYYADTINFKYYGSNSSRTRTLVIGVRKNLVQYISPVELFPNRKKEHTLRETIGDLPSLSIMGEICDSDIYHGNKGKTTLTPAGISLPNVSEVTHEEWDAHDFDKESALDVKSVDGDVYDFYVNMENIHLQSELKPIAKNEAKMKLLKARYKYSMVLIGLSILGYGKNHHDPENEQKSEIEEPEQTVRLVTRMLSPIILPMIAVMGDDLGEIIN